MTGNVYEFEIAKAIALADYAWTNYLHQRLSELTPISAPSPNVVVNGNIVAVRSYLTGKFDRVHVAKQSTETSK